MLAFDQLDVLPDNVVTLYDELAMAIIRDIARRLLSLNFGVATAAHQVQQVTESGKLYKDVLKLLEELTSKSTDELNKTFMDAGVKSVEFDNEIYKAAGFDPSPLNLSPSMLKVLFAGLQKTKGTMRNLVSTTAEAAQQTFVDASDMAYMKISSGAFSYNEAIRDAAKEVAEEGAKVINYPSGRKDQIDVAIRRAVLTGVSQTVGMITWETVKELGVKEVQTSAHIGARNEGEVPENHEKWQGRIFSLEKDGKYPDFITTTGYGTGEGLHGWNCRHSFFPFFEGISENAYKEDDLKNYANKTVKYGGENISFYEATQIQRGIERKIRKKKREIAALEETKQDNWQEWSELQSLQAEMRRFISETGLDRQRIREQIGQRVKKSKAS
jgi:hypothetical protein